LRGQKIGKFSPKELHAIKRRKKKRKKETSFKMTQKNGSSRAAASGGVSMLTLIHKIQKKEKNYRVSIDLRPKRNFYCIFC